MKRTDEKLMQIARERVEFKRHLRIYIIVNIGIWLFWVFTSAGSSIWPIWVTLGWGIGVVSHYYKVHGSPSEKVQKEFEKLKKEEMRKED